MNKVYTILILGFSVLSSYAEEKSLAAFDQIVQEMNKNYYDPTFSGLDWEGICKETRKKIDQAATRKEGYGHIQDLLENFEHSHIMFVSPLGEPRKIPLGVHKQINFSLRLVEDKWVVVSVKQDSDAWKAGLRKGFIIVSVGKLKGEDLKPAPGIHRYMKMKRVLDYYPTRTLTLGVLDTDGKSRKLEWKLSNYKGGRETLGNMSGSYEVKTETINGKIGYISFNRFMFKPVLEVIQHIKTMQKEGLKAVIIDVRGNPGGTGILASAVAKEFCNRNYILGTMQQQQDEIRYPVIAQPKPFNVPVVILTDSNSASTSEIFAGGMQANGSATVIGSVTAGEALPSFIIKIKGGGKFQFPVADFKTPDGRSLEGVGVKPDIEIKDTLKSLRQGKDLARERAIRFLQEKLRKQ